MLGAMATRTDAALVEAWQQGDRKAGSELFERHYEGIVRFFRNKVGPDAAADLVQKTLLACFEALARFRGETSFRTYLFSIAYRLMCKHFEAQRRNRIDLQTASVHDLGGTPSEVLAAREEQRLVLSAMRRIPLEYQVLLELCYWEQLTAAEAALVVEIPVGTAKTRLRRGKQLLEEQLRTLATRPELLTSTLGELERWTRSLREPLSPTAIPEGPP
jgi:RNA polymerase sigma factor (sigma-70 family)